MKMVCFILSKVNGFILIIKDKLSRINKYFDELVSDFFYVRENLMKSKDRYMAALPRFIDSFKENIFGMRNVISVFLVYSVFVFLVTLFTDNYKGSFFRDLLVNANASILDFFILGVVLYYFESRKEKKESVSELIEELGHIAKHSSVELNILKVKIIKKLNSKGVFNINVQKIILTPLFVVKFLSFKKSDLSALNVSETYVRNCVFEDCNIQSLNIEKSKVKDVIFKNCQLKNIKAYKANFINVTFENCNLSGGDFRDGKLKNCIIKECDFLNVIYRNADFCNANILGSKNIDIDKMVEAENLDYLKCSDEILHELKKKIPKLKYSKSGYRGGESNPKR